jgi:hypothetical protein
LSGLTWANGNRPHLIVEILESSMSDISFHVAGGCFGGGHAVFPDALAFPVEPQ